ncbi:MAG: hypothetical protein V2A78_09660 [bacterium]
MTKTDIMAAELRRLPSGTLESILSIRDSRELKQAARELQKISEVRQHETTGKKDEGEPEKQDAPPIMESFRSNSGAALS